MKILITGGGTEEKIDSVRRISNTSTGKTALFLAQSLSQRGHSIYYLRSYKAPSFPQATLEKEFVSSQDLENSLAEVLRSTPIDLVIQCAAVSDFLVDKLVIHGELFDPEAVSKISSQDPVEIVLKKRDKIISKIKTMSPNSSPIVIGFKLTNSETIEEQDDASLALSLNPHVDFVIQNNLKDIQGDLHPTRIFFKDQVLYEGDTKQDLANNLHHLIQSFKEGYSYDSLS